MLQLGQLQELVEEFEARDTVVVTIANEERDPADSAKVRNHLGGEEPAFVNLVDMGWSLAEHFERTTAYWVDAEGVVRQVFPMEIYSRPPWWAILNEIDDLLAQGAR